MVRSSKGHRRLRVSHVFTEPRGSFRGLLLIISEASSFRRMAGCYQLQSTDAEEKGGRAGRRVAAAFALALALAHSLLEVDLDMNAESSLDSLNQENC